MILPAFLQEILIAISFLMRGRSRAVAPGWAPRAVASHVSVEACVNPRFLPSGLLLTPCSKAMMPGISSLSARNAPVISFSRPSSSLATNSLRNSAGTSLSGSSCIGQGNVSPSPSLIV